MTDVISILFLHGLESGPHGRKVQRLREAGYRVVARQMPCGIAAMGRDPAVFLFVVVGLSILLTAIVVAGPLAMLVALIALAATTPLARARLFRRAFARSVAVQLDALSVEHIDIIVGSSFGGAVGVELLRTGAWNGPALLLCPAYKLIAGRAWLDGGFTCAQLPESHSAKVLVVHGHQDEVVRMQHSQQLVFGSNAHLLVVEDDHRLNAVVTPQKFRDWIGLAMRTSAT